MKLIIINDPQGDVQVDVCDDGSLSYITPWFRVDGDGDPRNVFRDPCWQEQTSLQHKGRPVNALTVPYAVINPLVAKRIAGIVLGCEGLCSYKGKTVPFVVADVGPRSKIGEGSVMLAKRLGIPHSPVSGGQDGEPVHWKIYPGRAAEIDGETYTLKPLGT